jgi:hypothetical protein
VTAFEIQSIGPPHEIHADRVVAEMLRDLARKRAHLQDAVAAEFRNARDGNPRAQQKMAARMLAAGAAEVKLEPGKRGRYSLFFYEWAGWDPIRDQAICVGDPIPEKPWSAWHLTLIDSYGRGRLDVTSVPALLADQLIMRCREPRSGSGCALMSTCWSPRERFGTRPPA